MEIDDHLQQVAAGFSVKAQIYDVFGQDHPNLARMRQLVYAHVLAFLRPGERILELNAGTGADAAFFASQGYTIHATDLSTGMVAAIAQKAAYPQFGGRLTFQLCSFTELEQVRPGPYQYVFSNFGGLNCIPDLAVVARNLEKVLTPGGRITWVIMPPICPWELAQCFKGQFRQAFRRLHPGGTRAHVEGAYFQVYYFTPRQVLAALGSNFRVLKLEGLSITTPPADRKDFAIRHPGLFRFLVGLDDLVAPFPPFNGWGDFFILTAEYRSS